MTQCPDKSLYWVNIHSHRLAVEGELTVCHKLAENTSNIDLSTASISGHTVYAVGMHPWFLTSCWLDDFRKLAHDALKGNVVAIGETGLDKKCDTPYAIQYQAFEAHIKLSEQLQKPLIIHCVKAIDDVIALYKKYNPRQAWVLHGFRGNPNQAHSLQKLGIYLSFGLKHNVRTLAICAIDLMFLETDDLQENIESLYIKASFLKNINVLDLKKKMLHNFIQITRYL